MLKKLLFLLSLIFITNNLFSFVENGTIDLSNYNFSKLPPVSLIGDWFLTLENGETITTKVPGGWDGNKGSVIYGINIISKGEDNIIIAPSQINTKYKLFINDKFITENLQYKTLYIPVNLVNGLNEIKIYVTNNTDKFGGIRGFPFIGSFNDMVKKHEMNILRDTFISGGSFIMFLFFFILYWNYKDDKSILYFSLICFYFAIRSIVTNDKIIFNYIPNISYFIVSKLEYHSIYSIPLLVILFLYNYYNKDYFRVIYKILIILGYILNLFVILTPPKIYISLLFVFYLYVALCAFLVLMTVIICIKKKKADAIKIFISIYSLFIAGAFDAINVVLTQSEFYIIPSSMIIFILIMSFIVSRKELKKIKNIDRLTVENTKVNKYLSKFVPNAFIKTVGIGDLTTIKRGDGVEKYMTVLFTSIVGFQHELKLHKAEETIRLLNRCYSIISPIIEKNGGFIDKFIDETVMALFPGKPEDAINAVYEINERLEEFYTTNSNEKPMSIRSGIHIGNQYIGIVGDHKRVDATVISKVVNTASRINSFTSKIKKNILISDDVYENLSNKDIYKSMYMGRVKLKGKMNFIGIHCLYDKKIEEADHLFSITMKKLENSSLDKIEDVLLNIRNMFPAHKPTQYYLGLIKDNKKLEDLEK